jgi:hypothetical protein
LTVQETYFSWECKIKEKQVYFMTDECLEGFSIKQAGDVGLAYERG